MKKIKIGLVVLCFLVISGLVAANEIYSQETIDHLEGKIIVLDAGHGGEYPGAVNKAYDIAEKDVNLAVVYELKKMLEDNNGANVVLTRECDETILSRRDRVAIAEQKCADEFEKECDVLVSVHHNGSDDPEHNGTMVIYNEMPEKPLAISLHDKLLESLFDNESAFDEGYENGGYGMTVFFTPATITEAYYITNDCEAELFVNGAVLNNEKCPSNIYGDIIEQDIVDFSCDENGTSRKFSYGSSRVEQEALALYEGILNYFSDSETDGPRQKNK